MMCFWSLLQPTQTEAVDLTKKNRTEDPDIEDVMNLSIKDQNGKYRNKFFYEVLSTYPGRNTDCSISL